MTQEEMEEDYKESLSINKIAEASGMSFTGVRLRLLKQGVELRSRSADLPQGLKPTDEFCHKGHATAEYGSYKKGRFYCKKCNAETVASSRRWGSRVSSN